MKFEELSENAKEKAINDLVNFYVNTVMSYNDIEDGIIYYKDSFFSKNHTKTFTKYYCFV